MISAAARPLGTGLTLLSLLATSPAAEAAGPIRHVIHISVDGLRPDAVTFLGSTNLPNFYRLRREGAFTDNARTDFDYTITLPNHTSQVTGRGVAGAAGHNWTNNTDPTAGQTLESNRGFYVAGAFDVAHDNGLRTGEFASKTKFSLFATSWNASNGALDLTGPNNGRNKIDVYHNIANTATLVNALITNMNFNPFGYAFLHLADPDNVGHSQGWFVTNGSPYCESIKLVDSRLGALFNMIDTNTTLKGSTAIVLTADHGGGAPGAEFSHVPATAREHYTIPFYVWGPGVMPQGDLYLLNPGRRLNPGTSRPTYSAPVQPIRNGEAANVSLTLLGLGPVPDSTINPSQDLAFTLPAPELALARNGTDLIASFALTTNALHDIEMTDPLGASAWSCNVSNILGAHGSVTNVNLGPANQPGRFYRLRVHF
jgi:hypothetical protein